MAFVIGANLADDRVVLAKTVPTDYLRKAEGGITATALLSDEQATHVQQADKGELTLESSVTDETGVTVSRCRGGMGMAFNLTISFRLRYCARIRGSTRA